MSNVARSISQSDAPAASAVRRGEELDALAVATYLNTRLPGLDGELQVLQFPKGSANLTYLLRSRDRRLVLRRPPFGRLAPGAHDMGREYKTLSRLWQAFPPAPRALLLCDDPAVIGAPFLIMEFREGVGVWDIIPKSMQHHVDVGQRIGFAVVDALSELHLVLPDSYGLADLGKSDGFVERQVSGWRRRWELVASEGAADVMARVAELLAGNLPRAQRASILHNDMKLDNCQFAPDAPDKVKSVFDWDMSTLGDPLIDLGILLNYWPDQEDTVDDRGLYVDGMEGIGLPSHAAVVNRYAANTGLDVSSVTWYLAFAAWKTAVVRQQLYDRFRRGESTDPRMARLGEHVTELGRRALRLLERG